MAPLAEREAAGPRIGRLDYRPGLDGIRAIAVVVVFLFHAGVSWVPGGFLGVSVFFTLSGFLITRLLLEDVDGHGGVELVRFWGRRLRRLMPAALLTVAFVLLLAATSASFDTESLRLDALATLGYAANWRFLSIGQSYSQLFATPSPLLHFWSLAIEEQFYLVFPIVVAGVAAVSRSRGDVRARLRVVLTVVLAMSLLANILANRAGDGDFGYYSLPTRATELLAGAVLATCWTSDRLLGAARARWFHAVLGVAGLVTLGALCATATTSTPWVERGGLAFISVLSLAILVAALPRGAFSTMLGSAPLRALGRISYGVYLFHWPVILWLDTTRVGLRGAPLVLVQASVTLALAIASFHLVEQPVRQGRLVRGRARWVGAPVAAALVAGAALLVTTTAPSAPSVDIVAASRHLERVTTDVPESGAVASAPSIPRVAFFGDSTALMTAVGVGEWSKSNAQLMVVPGSTGLSCGITRGGMVHAAWYTIPARRGCEDWATEWARIIDEQQPDLAVIQVGPLDVADRQLAGSTTWLAPGDPVYDEFLEHEMLAAADVFLERGVQTVWLTSPHITRPSFPNAPEIDPTRTDRFNQILRSVGALRPGLQIVDLAKWVQQWPAGEYDRGLRPDGVHLSIESARDAMAPWLGPALVRCIASHPPRVA